MVALYDVVLNDTDNLPLLAKKLHVMAVPVSAGPAGQGAPQSWSWRTKAKGDLLLLHLS